jgi:hypothetical protein
MMALPMKKNAGRVALIDTREHKATEFSCPN